jgi:midasin
MMISSQFEGLPVVWNLLRKEIQKLQPKFPEEVGLFLVSYHPFLSLWFMIL